MLKFRIKTKILLILLGLSLISLISFAYIAYGNMRKLGDYALQSNRNLGAKAVDDSKNALIKEAEENLLLLTKSQADVSNAIFERIESEVEFMAQFASVLWDTPPSPAHGNSFSMKVKPDDIYSASVYVLAPNASGNVVKEDLRISSEMDRIFKTIHNNDPNVTALFVGTKSGLHRRYPWYSGFDPSFDPRERSWYEKAVKADGSVWSELYIDASKLGLIITCSAAIHDAENRLIGAVGADVTLETINKKIISSQLNADGQAFLIDGHGDIIAKEGLSGEDKSWKDGFEAENLLQSANPEIKKIAKAMVAGDAGITRFKDVEDEKYIAYTPIKSTNWSMGVIMPVEEIIAPALATQSKMQADTAIAGEHIRKHIGRVQGILLGVFTAMTLVISILAYGLSRKITKPILKLDEGAKAIGGGDLDYQLEVKTGDEIEELADAFNKMTSDLKICIENLRETTAAKKRIESELEIASQIQLSMLPTIFPPFPDREEFGIYATMEPAKEVGGDFYDFFLIGEDKLCLIIGDVSGKGVPASLFMVISKTLLKTEALRGISPDEILHRVNNILYPDNDNNMFVTVFCVILDIKTGEMQFANGGHNPPLICNDKGNFQFIQMPKGFVLGPMPDMEYECKELTLNPNDVIFLYTDGVTEAMNREHEQFSDERLKQCLSNIKCGEIEDIIHGVRAEMSTFVQGADQSDDITMLALKYKGCSSPLTVAVSGKEEKKT